jgi:hypothetical protein
MTFTYGSTGCVFGSTHTYSVPGPPGRDWIPAPRLRGYQGQFCIRDFPGGAHPPPSPSHTQAALPLPDQVRGVREGQRFPARSGERGEGGAAFPFPD